MLDLWNIWIDALHTPFNPSTRTCFLCIDGLTLDGDGVGASGSGARRHNVNRLPSNN